MNALFKTKRIFFGGGEPKHRCFSDELGLLFALTAVELLKKSRLINSFPEWLRQHPEI